MSLPEQHIYLKAAVDSLGMPSTKREVVRLAVRLYIEDGCGRIKANFLGRFCAKAALNELVDGGYVKLIQSTTPIVGVEGGASALMPTTLYAPTNHEANSQLA